MKKQSSPTRKSASSRSWSLAIRLTAWYACFSFLSIAVAVGFLYWALVKHLNTEVDRYLGDRIHILRSLVETDPNGTRELKSEVLDDLASQPYTRVLVRVLKENGQVIIESPGISHELSSSDFPSPISGDDEPLLKGIDLKSRSRKIYRGLSVAVTLPQHVQKRIIQVGVDRSNEERLLSDYQERLWLALGAALVLSVLGGYLIALRGTKPVREMAHAAGKITSDTLHTRLPVAGLPSELSALARTLNETLDRLQESFSRLSQFSADLAHELRTPINNLCLESEVVLNKARTTEEYRETIGSFFEQGIRLSRMIDSLLFLARSENPNTQITKEEVNVVEELNRIQDFYEIKLQEKNLMLNIHASEGISANVDRTLFQRAVVNLLTNAIAHTPADGTITISANKDDSALHIQVSDNGSGISEKHLPFVFDRFYRADTVRTSSSGNMGLGLSMVKSIVQLHRGSIQIESAEGTGTSVRLSFPS